MRNDGTLDRRAVAATLLRDPGDLLVVTGLGAPSYDAAAAGERPLNFYLWGAMGGAAMVGLGIALAQPGRRVLVLTGDGEMLMGMGSLATIAAADAPNLAIAVLDNARYGETGSQHSHTGLTTDLAEALRPRLRQEALFAVVRISPAELPRHLPPRDGAYLADRFRRALGVTAD
jgi:thiamine pyrophosphate-dependent acetolactate synthase large subunit-like protein